MQFDVVLSHPPAQEPGAGARSQRRPWVEHTNAALGSLLRPGGLLCQVSPASFASPNNRAIEALRSHTATLVNLDAGEHLGGGPLAYYCVLNQENRVHKATTVVRGGRSFPAILDDTILWLPNDLCAESLSVHRKVMFISRDKLGARTDARTCRASLLRAGTTLSRERSDEHRFPVFHTHQQTWWSSVRQPWADQPKIMWSKSGKTRPFLDLGERGGTDMAFYVPVASERAGRILLHNMSLRLIRYVLDTARWSGFGSEHVFAALPALPTHKRLSDDALFDLFRLTPKERDHVVDHLG